MPAAVRTYLTTGIALVGAGVVTAAQLVPVPDESETRVVQRAVTLAAAVGAGQACSGYNVDGCDIWATQTYTPVVYDPSAGSWANVPANIINAIASIPRAYLDGLNDLSYGLEVTGSWWVYTPTNVLGFDPADEPKFAALANLLIPFKPLSNPLGEGITWWAKANLTMNEGCTGTAGPVCQDPGALLGTMFQVSTNSLIAGFKYPFIQDPVSPLEGSMGNPLPADYPGNIDRVVPWSQAYVQLNPFDPQNSVINYLKADPSTNRPEPITFAEVVSSITRLVKASHLDFYPFVPMSFLLKGWPYTALTPLFKPFLPWLCPDCNTINPAWPPGATEQPWPSASVPAVAAAEVPTTEEAAASPATIPSEPAVGAGTAAADQVSLTGAARRAQSRVARTAAADIAADPAATSAGQAAGDTPVEADVTQRRTPRTSVAGNARADRAEHSSRARAAARSGE